MNPNVVGLGLKICKQIVEKLGGNISVESVLNVGTSFQFTFKSNISEQNLDSDLVRFPFEEDKHNFIHPKSRYNFDNPFFINPLEKP